MVPFRRGARSSSGLVLAAVAVLAALAAPWVSAREVISPLGYLTIHGPNDGEPLNETLDVWIEVSSPCSGHLSLHDGTRDLLATPVLAQAVCGSQEIPYRLDILRYRNGPLTLSARLTNDSRTTLLDHVVWRGLVENPVIEPCGPRMGAFLPLLVEGKRGDSCYRVEVGCEESQLLKPPHSRQAVQAVIQGYFQTGSSSVSSPLGPPEGTVASSAVGTGTGIQESDPGTSSKIVVLNVDSLIAGHTLDGWLIVWTYNAHTGRWSRSALLSLKALPAPLPGLAPSLDPTRVLAPGSP